VRILVPTADYPPIEGGISSVALNVTRELAALGHDVTVIAPRFPGQDDFDRSEPVRVIRYSGYRLGWGRLLPILAACRPHVKDTDLILAVNITYGGIVGYFARRNYGKPYVTFAYAYEFLKFQNVPFVEGCMRSLYSGARAVVAISHFTRDRLAEFGVAGPNVNVILPGAPQPTPTDAVRLKEVAHRYTLDDARVVLAVGRFIPRKGQITLVRALPKILARFPNTVLVLVGQGPCLYETVQETHRLGVREQTLFPGPLPDDDIRALYQICDVFALPTGVAAGGQVEGFGLVFAEAGAYGKPVVAGRSGGVVDAVLDGETGLLVEPDNPNAVADAVCEILSDPALAQRLGENGRRRVEEELNWRTFTKRLIDAAGLNIVDSEGSPV